LRTRLLAGVLALTLVVSPVLQAQGTMLFTMNLASPDAYGFAGAYPTDGSSGSSLNNGTYYTFTHRAGSGPTSGNAAEIAMIPVTPPVAGGANPCSSQPSCQDYVGWGGTGWSTAIAQGGSLYIRMYFRVTAWNDPRSFDGGTWGGKMILVGDGCSDDTNRVIWNFQSSTTGASSAPQFELDKNIQGVGINYTLPTDGAWHAYQARFRTSSTDIATDGQIQIWRDSDVEGSPTASSGTFAWDSDCIGSGSATNMKTGAYMDWVVTTAGGQSVTYQFGGLEFSTGFDNTWAADMGAAPPGSAYRFRFRTAWQLIMDPRTWARLG
jgi:hypothetical protein